MIAPIHILQIVFTGTFCLFYSLTSWLVLGERQAFTIYTRRP
jgi:hypothetical protein